MDKLLKFNNKLVKSGNGIVGKIPSVKIGNQIWTSENLNINDGLDGIYVKDIGTSYDFDYNKTSNYFYTYTAAKRIVDTIPGWRIPTKEDFEILFSTINNDASKLKTQTGWSKESYVGTNETGFSLPGGGWVGGFNKTLNNFGYTCRIWSSTLEGSTECWALNFEGRNTRWDYYNKNSAAFYVRLIKDS